ncbi:MAG: hypothetical protein NT154_09805 [Verrucomicrobia bacterium]|nr:hypothetical protein [Verrucomicrobiota bacterium]
MSVIFENAEQILDYCRKVRQAPVDHLADYIQPLFDLDYDHCDPQVKAAVDAALFYAMTGQERGEDDVPAPKDPGSASPTEPPTQPIEPPPVGP